MNDPKVSLQINLAPSDLRYVTETLPHQLRTFGDRVAEIVLTVDVKQSRAHRAATDDYAAKLAQLRAYLEPFAARYPHLRIVEVDYRAETVAAVGRTFLGRDTVPNKACDGSAFYAYLYGMFSANGEYVFHLDSDMLFGGGSPSWLAEAVEILERNRDVLACYPFPGPPTPDGLPSRRRLTSLWNDVSFAQTCRPSGLQKQAYEYNEVTTRAFVFDRRRFASGELKIPLARPRFRRFLRALVHNTSTYLLLEDCLTVLLNRTGMRAIGFIGSGAGMWTLHPRYRCERLYAELPSLVRRVESNDIPDGQRGDFDMNDAMMDWSEFYRTKTRWKRFRHNLQLARLGIADRFSRTR